MSILLVEQYVDFAMRLADTYAVMDVGRIVAAARPRPSSVTACSS